VEKISRIIKSILFIIFFLCHLFIYFYSRDSYKEHIKCISEQEKYGGANYSAPTNMNKGEKKQNQWFEIVQSAINLNSGSAQAKVLLKRLQSYPNTPRKRAKFIVSFFFVCIILLKYSF
jgi:TnpA family transposase